MGKKEEIKAKIKYDLLFGIRLSCHIYVHDYHTVYQTNPVGKIFCIADSFLTLDL